MAAKLHAFSRTEQLIGRAALDALGRSRVAVFGIGGVGSFAVEALVRAGVGRFVNHLLFGGATMTGLFPGFGLQVAKPSIFSMAESLVTAAGFLLFFFGGLRYAAWLFRRVPDLRSARTCTLYMWLLPLIAIVGLCVCVGPLVAKVLHMVLLWQLRGHLAQALRQQRLGVAVVAEPPPPQDPSSGRQP